MGAARCNWCSQFVKADTPLTCWHRYDETITEQILCTKCRPYLCLGHYGHKPECVTWNKDRT